MGATLAERRDPASGMTGLRTALEAQDRSADFATGPLIEAFHGLGSEEDDGDRADIVDLHGGARTGLFEVPSAG